MGGVVVIKKYLEDYGSNKEEIKELKYKLLHLGEGDTMIDNDTIFDYRKGYPVPQAVIGVDWKKIDRMKARYENRIKQLEKECDEAEEFIENISDSVTRRAFRMYYMDGLSQKKIADQVHLDRSRISRKINDYLKNAHKAHKAQL